VTAHSTLEGGFEDARDVLLEAYREFVASGKTAVEIEDGARSSWWKDEHIGFFPSPLLCEAHGITAV
jgi:hypothetical protein